MAAPIHFVMKESPFFQPSGIFGQRNKKQARDAGLFDLTRSRPRSPAPPTPPMPAMIPTAPPHFGGDLFRTVLDRRGGSRIAERQRLGPLRWYGQDKQCADCGESQNFRHVH
jgi:hypothetical protein